MERRWWASELHALEGQDRVCKDQKAAGVRSILSGIKNNHGEGEMGFCQEAGS